MKTIFLTFFSFLLVQNSFSQGQIQGFTLDPASPTDLDYVRVYVDLVFSSGGCEVDNQSHSTTGSQTTASAHHCIGMLTVICDTRDTFELGYLQPGSHQFILTLTSGSGGPGCTAGVIPDDIDSISFSVTQMWGLEEHSIHSYFTLFPNPMSTNTTIKLNPDIKLTDAEIKMIDALGRTVKLISLNNQREIEINSNDLDSGLYFIQIIQDQKIIATQKLIVE